MGVVATVTVTPPLSPPEDDSQIAKSAVAPGCTMASREKALTLSHSFTCVVATMKATAGAVLGAGVVPLGVGDAVPCVGDGLVGVAAGDDDDGDGVIEGEGLVDVGVDVGDGLGVMMDVTHGSGTEISREVSPVPPGLRVRAVVATTPATMHRPVMNPVTADPPFQTITRPTPILRS